MASTGRSLQVSQFAQFGEYAVEHGAHGPLRNRIQRGPWIDRPAARDHLEAMRDAAQGAAGSAPPRPDSSRLARPSNRASSAVSRESVRARRSVPCRAAASRSRRPPPPAPAQSSVAIIGASVAGARRPRNPATKHRHRQHHDGAEDNPPHPPQRGFDRDRRAQSGKGQQERRARSICPHKRSVHCPRRSNRSRPARKGSRSRRKAASRNWGRRSR